MAYGLKASSCHPLKAAHFTGKKQKQQQKTGERREEKLEF